MRLFLLLLQCGLALHRKCMESCQLECEHRKGTVFGVDLSAIPRDTRDEVPFVVLQCTSEIEHRALSVQVGFIPTRNKMVVKMYIWCHDQFSAAVFVSGCVSCERVQATHPKALPGL